MAPVSWRAVGVPDRGGGRRRGSASARVRATWALASATWEPALDGVGARGGAAGGGGRCAGRGAVAGRRVGAGLSGRGWVVLLGAGSRTPARPRPRPERARREGCARRCGPRSEETGSVGRSSSPGQRRSRPPGWPAAPSTAPAGSRPHAAVAASAPAPQAGPSPPSRRGAASVQAVASSSGSAAADPARTAAVRRAARRRPRAAHGARGPPPPSWAGRPPPPRASAAAPGSVAPTAAAG